MPQLRRMLLLRVLDQLSNVYSVLHLQNYEALIKRLGFDRFEVRVGAQAEPRRSGWCWRPARPGS